MSIFSDIADWVSGLWEKFKSAITDILQVLKKAVVIALIILAIIFIPGVGAAIGLAIAGSWWIVGLLIVGAFLLDPEFTGEILSDIGDAIGEVAEIVGDVTGEVLSSLAGGLFSGGLGVLLLIGVGLFFFLSNKKDDDPTIKYLPPGGVS
jgi:phosphoglycerol transferase MdoB-like AlkP superfamily enzyme